MFHIGTLGLQNSMHTLYRLCLMQSYKYFFKKRIDFLCLRLKPDIIFKQAQIPLISKSSL